MSNIDKIVKKKIIIGSILLAGLSMPMQNLEAQNKNVGIGTENPDASALLDLNVNDASFTTKLGLLIPRVALTATNVAAPITGPANSLLVYNTATAGSAPNNVVPGFYYWDAATNSWIRLVTTSEPGAVPFNLIQTGTNTAAAMTVSTGASVLLTGTGIVESSRFKGAGSTSDAVDLATNEAAGILPIAKGGTGVDGTPTNGQLLIGNGTGYTLGGITPGANITVTPGAGSIQIAAPGLESVLSFDNGLTRTGNAITLGGTLTSNTTIEIDGNNLQLSSTGDAGNIILGKFTSAGILKNDASGVLSSSLITDSDVSATAEINVAKLANGTDNQILVSNAGNVQWTTPSFITTETVGTGTSAGGDLSVTYPNPTVSKIQGNPVEGGVPLNGETFKWNGTTSTWEYVAAGTVSSVGLTMPDLFAVTGSPITGSGTLGVGLKVQGTNAFLAGPVSGDSAAPNFRKLSLTDMPNTMVRVEGTGNDANSLAFFNGGTGIVLSSNNKLRYNGTTLVVGTSGVPDATDPVSLIVAEGNIHLRPRAGSPSVMRFYDTGTPDVVKSIGLKAPATIDATEDPTFAYTLPAAKPIANQLLQSDVDGYLSWVSSAIVDEGTIEGQTLRYDATNTKWIATANLTNDGANLTISNATELRFTDGIDTVGFKAPADIADGEGLIYTLPVAPPQAGQILQSNAAGELSWVTLSGGSGSLPDGSATNGETIRWNGSAWVVDATVLRNNGTSIGIGTAPTATEALSIAGDVAISTGDLSVSGGNINLTTGNLAISGGSVAVAAPVPDANQTVVVAGRTYILVSYDGIISLNPGTPGQILILQKTGVGTTTLEDAGTNMLNGIWTVGSGNANSTITLIFDGTNWVEIARANN